MTAGASVRRRFEPGVERIGPYVPSLTADWLRDCPQQRYRSVDGTLVFADISGFTRLTGLLAGRGKIGAEEMAELINATFERLLSAAYDYGAGLIKYGGDAVLLWFAGEDHPTRGSRAAHAMQAVMRRDGRLDTSRGPLRLRMSIGIHSAPTDFLLVGEHHRELVITGPAITTLTAMEKRAGAGQTLLSAGTRAALDTVGQSTAAVPVEGLDDAFRLVRAPAADPTVAPLLSVDYGGVPIEQSLSGVLREHIRAASVDHEHRRVTTGFIKFSGTDRLLRERGPEALTDAVEQVVGAAQRAAVVNGVTFLPSDIYADGGKLLLIAGAPRRTGAEQDRMIATLRTVLDAGGTELVLRAGMNAGEVFVGDYGPPYRRTYSLLGESVNLAARLMEHADPGELLATPSVLEDATGSFTTVVRAPFAVKGVKRPVVALSVGAAAVTDVPRESQATPMLGRETELAQLLAAVPTPEQRSGAVIELIGPPGIGKSRLLSELRTEAQADVLWTDGDVYRGGVPYAPFEQLLRRRLGVAPMLPSARLAERVRQVVGTRAPTLLPWLPLIAVVAGLELPLTREVELTEPAARKELLEQLTSDLLTALVTEPTVLVFNDTHLMDDASIDLIGRLCADAAERPWLVVVSRREEGRSPIADSTPAQRLELAPLAPTTVTALIGRATDAPPLTPHRTAWLIERAAGNPLFAQELLAHAGGDGDISTLPQSVEDAIAARIDRLAPAERRTLRCAAVLGVLVERPLLEEVLGGDEEARLDRLDAFLEDSGDGLHLRFSHQLVRQVAYEGLPYRRRSELHARTATALTRRAGAELEADVELMAVHCFHGARFGDAWRYALIAAERAKGRYAIVEAAESYRLALAAGAQLPELNRLEIARVREALADAHYELGEFSEADRALRQALRCPHLAPTSAAQLHLKLAKLREVSGQHAAALRWLARGQRQVVGRRSQAARALNAQLISRRARIHQSRGQHRAALRDALEAIRLARASGARRALAEALEYADAAETSLAIRHDSTRTMQAVAIYQELEDMAGEARVRNTLGVLAYYRGEWPAAVEHYAAAAEAYTQAGRWWGAALARSNLAEVLIDQRRLAEAERVLEEALAAWRGSWTPSDVAFAETLRGKLAARAGDTRAALEHLDSARARYHQLGEASDALLVEVLIAETHILAGDSLTAIGQASDLLDRIGTREGGAALAPLLHRVRGLALIGMDRRTEGAAALADSLTAARELAAPNEIAFTLRELLRTGPPGLERADLQAEYQRLTATLGLQD